MGEKPVAVPLKVDLKLTGEKPVEEPIATKLMGEKPDGVAGPPPCQGGGPATPQRQKNKIINNGFWLMGVVGPTP
jgi:hypothetical protein